VPEHVSHDLATLTDPELVVDNLVDLVRRLKRQLPDSTG
jgi:hypothetical protein